MLKQGLLLRLKSFFVLSVISGLEFEANDNNEVCHDV